MRMRLSSIQTAIIPFFTAITFLAGSCSPESKEWLQRAAQTKSMPNQLIMMARISLKSGDSIAANHYYEKVLGSESPKYHALAFKDLSEINIAKGDYQSAWRYQKQADSIKYEMLLEQKQKEVTEIQLKYDASVIEKDLSERINVILAIILFLLIISIAALIYLFRRKEKAYVNHIQKNNNDIASYKSKIVKLEQSCKIDSEEIKLLNQDINKLQDTNSLHLGMGKELYDMFLSKHRERPISSEDEQRFTDYFAFTHYERFNQLTKDYSNLSLRLTTYLILRNMGYNDKEFADMFCVSMTTIRSYRHRIKIAKKEA